MARMIVGAGMDKYIQQLANLEFKSPSIAGKAVYEGAKIVADAIKQEIESLPVEESKHHSGDDKTNGVTKQQKDGLRDGFGIATMKQEGSFYNVKAGFHGYNATHTDTHPGGQPNAMIARSVEAGTSFRKKNPFVSRAVRKSKDAAERKMAQVVNDETAKIMK